MNKWLVVLLPILVIGCAYEGKSLQSYIDNPGSIVEDPHFADYQEHRDSLESRYLSKEITYAEYKQELEVLDRKYDKEVEQREAVVLPTE